MPLHRIACQRERFPEVLARHGMTPSAKLKLGERGVVERILGEAVRVGDRANLFEAALRTLALPDGDGPIESDNGRRTYCH